MFEKNTVILSLKDYLDLIKENERLRERFKSINEEVEYLDIERKKWRKHILEEAERTTIWRYDEYELSRIIDSEDWVFGLVDYEKLLKVGFTMEELVDYIIERREFYENGGKRKWVNQFMKKQQIKTLLQNK